MARHWSAETDAEADELFATFSEAEIRRRQGLCTQQIAMAVSESKRGRDMSDALADLHAMEDALARTMLARIQPTPEET